MECVQVYIHNWPYGLGHNPHMPITQNIAWVAYHALTNPWGWQPYAETCRGRKIWNVLTLIFGIMPSILHTGCNRRNGPNFGRVFLMLNYTETAKNTYVQSWTVYEIMAIENGGLPSVPRTIAVSWESSSVCSSQLRINDARGKGIPLHFLQGDTVQCSKWVVAVQSCQNSVRVFSRGILQHAFCIWFVQW
jgi:hypothetical protein